MEFDIGTLIYIIITIVAVLAGVLKKKKPGGKTTPAGEGTSSPGLLERLEKELSGLVGETKETVKSVRDEFLPGTSGHTEAVVDEVVYEPISEKDLITRSGPNLLQQYEGIFDPDSIENKHLLDSEANRITNRDQIMDVVDLDTEEATDYYEIVKDFDLRTAVIYSTIINRKEY